MESPTKYVKSFDQYKISIVSLLGCTIYLNVPNTGKTNTESLAAAWMREHFQGRYQYTIEKMVVANGKAAG